MGTAHARWLLCRPDFYDVQYEINPWMKVSRAPERAKAQAEWRALESVFRKLSVTVELVDPVDGLPDMVFTANAGLVSGKKAVLSRFRHVERQGEEEHFERWFSAHGFEVIKLTSGSFEGEGDALFAEDRLVGGYGFRSDRPVYEEIAEKLGLAEVLPVQLINSYFYHLDTCFCPLGDGTAMIYPGAFTPEDVRALEKFLTLIAVPENDAKRFACNAVVLGKDVIVPAGCEETYAILRARGFTVHPVQLDEYIKAGGAAKCLSLKV